MKITPVAFDSMGVRSQCTFVETEDVKVLIDPAANLGPLRFGLPPHAREWLALKESWKRILEYAKKADVITVGHYHYDHHEPDYMLSKVFKGKTAIIKNPDGNINQSQKKRAAYFVPKLHKVADKVEIADGNEFEFGKTKIKFSPAVFHGIGPRLGFVVETLIDDGKYKFIHANDVEGPAVEAQADFILKNKPNLVFVDGPLSYIMLRYGTENMKKANDNLVKIIQSCPLDALVIDHHLLRDIGWKKRIEPVFAAAEKKGIKVLTAAEYAGQEINNLEANRTRNWKEFPDEKADIPDELAKIVTRKEE